MQVSCSNCGATYTFDSSAIPATGYNAQCATCSHVFFVAPEGSPSAPEPTPTLPEPEPEPVFSPSTEPPPTNIITAVCPNCDVIYEFGADAVPPGGYDARCTECNTVFFVGGTAPASTPTPVEPGDLPRPAEPVSLGAPKHAAPAHELPPIDDDNPHPTSSDMLAMGDALGDPDDLPEGVSLEDDFHQLLRTKKRRRLMLLGAAVALLGVPLMLYVVAPGAWDASLGPVLGIKARIHPDAVPLYEQAVAEMWKDRRESYESALRLLTQALEIDPLYPAAIGLAAQAHVFVGQDMQEEAKQVRARAEALLAQSTALQAQKPPSKDAEAQGAALREQALALDAKASKLVQAGTEELTKSGALLSPVLNRFSDSPEVRVAAGIYRLASDASRAAEAKPHLQAALAQRGLTEGAAAKDINDPWLLFFNGLVLANAPGGREQALSYFEAAAARQPAFQRARYQQLVLWAALGKPEKVKKLAQEILTVDPQHVKAKARRDAQAEPPPAVLAEAPKDSDAPGKGKRKKKRKR